LRDRDKSLGAYIGAAIGDAMGGPVECNHAMRIRQLVGEIRGFLPYQKPYALIDIQPGYALHPEAGNVTDDTFIRGDFTRFFLSTRPPRTPGMLAEWLLENADFSKWYQPIIEALHRIRRGEVTPEKCGLTFNQGGGAGWWTPVGILYAGDIEKASSEARNLCRIWKAPLEQDLLSAVQAGIADGIRERASLDSMIDAMFMPCRSLAQNLLERAIDIAHKSKNTWDLIERLYHNALISGDRYKRDQIPPTAADGPMPLFIEPLEYSDNPYSSIYFAEQIPLAIAAFVYAEGEPQAILTACMIGRDADSIATTVGSWVGALQGLSSLPKEWSDTVCEVNMKEIDIHALAEKLYMLDE